MSRSRRGRGDTRDALLEAAKAVFADAGVDAPVRAIAQRAGVGVGTVYRHSPPRSDLISAVFRREMDACADAATELEAAWPPGEALDRWVLRYTEFVATKQGLAAALHSGDPAYEPLRAHFAVRLAPTLERLLDPTDFLGAVANLSHVGGPTTRDDDRSERMVRLLLAGLRVPGPTS